MSTPPRIVIFGYGNPSRGDDALGPLLLERAGRLAAARGLEFAAVEDFQLQVEDALELEGRDLALFLDAAEAGPAPFAFHAVQPAEDASFSTHAISPAAVLHAFQRIHGAEPPPAFVLAVRGEAFELGAPLTPAAERNLQAAGEFLDALLERPAAEVWSARVAEPPARRAP